MIIPHRQEAFNSGVLSKKLLGKVSLDQYSSGLYSAQNMMILKHGPATTRPGFQFIYEVGDSSIYQRLIPFSVSATVNILIEMGVGYMRFYTFNGTDVGLIEDPEDPGNAYEVSHTLTEAQIRELQYAQSSDVLYMTHRDVPPMKLSRYSNTDWDLSNIVFLDGPYQDMNIEATHKLTPSATTGSITVTASGSGFTPFTADWVGRAIRIQNHAASTQWGWCKVTAYTDSTHVTATVIEDFATTTASSLWRVGEWSEATGYPGSVTIHQQRLCFGGWEGSPQKIVGSKLYNYTDFSPTNAGGEVTAEESFSFDLSTEKVDDIIWLRSFGTSLIAGTSGSEFSLYPSGSTLSPLDIASKRESLYGSNKSQPILHGSNIVFCERLNRRVRAISYDYVTDSYKGPELTVLSDGITQSGIEELVLQAQPQSIIWSRLADGTLAALTIDDDQKVYAWHSHNSPNGKLRSMVSLPSIEYNQDMVFAIIEREIDGNTVKYIEMLTRFLDDNLDIDNYIFLDSSLSLSQETPFHTISGLEHLEGEEVTVTSNNAIVGTYTVESGTIDLGVYLTSVVVGIPYDHCLETLPFRSPSPTQIDYALAKISITEVGIITSKTIGLKFTMSGSNRFQELFSRKANDYMDMAPSYYDELMKLKVGGTWEGMTKLRICGSHGIPAMIISIIVGIEANAD